MSEAQVDETGAEVDLESGGTTAAAASNSNLTSNNDYEGEEEPIPKEEADGEDATLIPVGSLNRVKSVDVRYTEDSYPDSGGLEWKDIKMTVFNTREGDKKEILHGLNGRIPKGKFLGILGGSGAGKSTFLNIISGRLTSSESAIAPKDSSLAQKLGISSVEVSGEVAFSDQSLFIGSDSDSLLGLAAYVQQSDILCATHTPEEAITFSARLRLPKEMSDEDKQSRVQRIISALKIEKCKDTLIGNDAIRGVSGGEKKRTSVGVELVTDPSLVFLDEPTTGLDSYSSLKTVQLLKELTTQDGDKTVIATLHQPSPEIVFTLDLVLILANGSIAYFGPPVMLTDYLSQLSFQVPPHSNPADVALNLIQTNPDLFIEAWKKRETSVFSKRPIDFSGYGNLDPRSTFPASICTQVSLLFHREWCIFTRDPRPSRMRLGQVIAFALLMGVLWWNLPHTQPGLRDRFGLTFFVSVSQAMLGISATIVAFPDQRLLFERERKSSMYHTITFILAKSLIEMGEAVLFSTFTALITYWMVGSDSRFWQWWLVLVAVTNCGGSIGQVIGCFARNASEGLQLMPVSFVPWLLFANFMVSLDQVTVALRWIQWIDFFKYAIDALVISEFKGQKYKPDKNGRGYTNGTDYLKSIGSDPDDLYFDYYMLFVLVFGFKLITATVLSLRNGW